MNEVEKKILEIYSLIFKFTIPIIIVLVSVILLRVLYYFFSNIVKDMSKSKSEGNQDKPDVDVIQEFDFIETLLLSILGWKIWGGLFKND